jgi:hypothetical protein
MNDYRVVDPDATLTVAVEASQQGRLGRRVAVVGLSKHSRDLSSTASQVQTYRLNRVRMNVVVHKCFVWFYYDQSGALV